MSSENSGISPPSRTQENVATVPKQKTPLKKEELEQIALKLKRKLTKASIAAKQSIPLRRGSVTGALNKTSPLNLHQRKILFDSPSSSNGKLLSSSPGNLYSPNDSSPHQSHSGQTGHTFLGSSPFKKVAGSTSLNTTPVKRTSLKGEGHMILEQIERPSTPVEDQTRSANSSETLQTTPTLQKKRLTVGTSHLLTPKRSSGGNGSSNDDEGADLLMYLATSPSPARPHLNTPRSNNQGQAGPALSQVSNTQFAGPLSGQAKPNPESSTFLAPPPLTPKRYSSSTTKTPQNRVTQSLNLFNALNAHADNGLPSSGLSLTPAGFNMNDYVNFFTPSPNGASSFGVNSRAFLKSAEYDGTPGVIATAAKHRIDGKMINFDKVLFGNSSSNNESLKE